MPPGGLSAKPGWLCPSGQPERRQAARPASLWLPLLQMLFPGCVKAEPQLWPGSASDPAFGGLGTKNAALGGLRQSCGDGREGAVSESDSSRV